MKKPSNFLTFSLLFSLFPILSHADFWTQKASITGGIRYAAVGFSIGNKGYIGTGYGTAYLQDFWEYDPLSNVWTQKADFAGAARYFGTGLSIGSKGYIGLGQSPSSFYQDFWEYNPATNTWSQKADFGGGLRAFSPTAFSINGYGYVGLGHDGIMDKQDFWQYDTLLNTWTQKALFPGLPRELAMGFSIGNKGYIGTGDVSSTSTYMQDFWEYDPVNDSWTALSNFAGIARFAASGFSIGNKGYAGIGFITGPVVVQDFWQYDIAANNWIQKANYGGIGRSHAVSFSIGTKGYIGTGFSLTNFLDDFWEYTPDSTTSINEVSTSNIQFTIFPNPAKDELFVNSYSLSGKEKIEITITDINRKKVYHAFPTPYSPLPTKINVSNFSKGIYFVEVNDGNQKAVRKFVKQ